MKKNLLWSIFLVTFFLINSVHANQPCYFPEGLSPNEIIKANFLNLKIEKFESETKANCIGSIHTTYTLPKDYSSLGFQYTLTLERPVRALNTIGKYEISSSSTSTKDFVDLMENLDKTIIEIETDKKTASLIKALELDKASFLINDEGDFLDLYNEKYARIRIDLFTKSYRMLMGDDEDDVKEILEILPEVKFIEQTKLFKDTVKQESIRDIFYQSFGGTALMIDFHFDDYTLTFRTLGKEINLSYWKRDEERVLNFERDYVFDEKTTSEIYSVIARESKVSDEILRPIEPDKESTKPADEEIIEDSNNFAIEFWLPISSSLLLIVVMLIFLLGMKRRFKIK